jgi:hypothetical protein
VAVSRDPLTDELTAFILAHQDSPLWSVGFLSQVWADVQPRLELADQRYVALLVPATDNNNGGAVLAIMDVGIGPAPGFRDCVNLHVMLPVTAAAVWASALAAEPAAPIVASKRWVELLDELRANRARAARQGAAG